MTNHLTLRLAWHDDGWNGHVCRDPESNVYCVGRYSYPGDMIARERDLAWESSPDVAGCHCSALDGIPPCAYSANAFGTAPIVARNEPPAFYDPGAEAAEFEVGAATACTWPYEQMYGDEVKLSGGGRQYDYEKRLALARQFFADLSPGRSLVFYYANKSNPFSEDDAERYVVVGVSRLKRVGEVMFYKNASERNRQAYAGAFVWQMPVTSNYPDEGFRIPYHRYRDDEDLLARLLIVPEQRSNFKYAAKHVGDDDALIYVEQLLGVVETLIEIGDDSEDWGVRKAWLQGLLAELWRNRGPYPGLPAVMDHLGFGELVPYYKGRVERGEGGAAKEAIFGYLNDREARTIEGSGVAPTTLADYRKRWALKLGGQDLRDLVERVLVRVDLDTGQVGRVLSDKRADNGLLADPAAITENPYLLSEQYVGDGDGDDISFSKVDHAVLPSPELGQEALADKDDWRRLRALCVEVLQRETKHSFAADAVVLHEANRKLGFLPDWKSEQFNPQYLDYYADELAEALVFREKGGARYVYLREVYEDEREVERVVRDLAGRSRIDLRRPFSDERWKNELYDVGSDLARLVPDEYERVIMGQVDVLRGVFQQPVSVVTGGAGTGKTTAIKALIRAVEHTSQDQESFALLAPTGKAADRIREKTGRDAMTVHSLLARNGWLNPNLTLKRSGGKRADEYTTYIVDEASMLDLALVAALFRAVNWNYVRRLVIVGDPNQLPPIGRGKVFEEAIGFLQAHDPESVGELETNVRQMENRVRGCGTGILELAAFYTRDGVGGRGRSQARKGEVEAFLRDAQDGGDIREDLRVLTWHDPDELEEKLLGALASDMEADGERSVPMSYQILSPYRGDLFGTEHLNARVQETLNEWSFVNKGTFGGVALFDKVIQRVNRARSRAYWAYDLKGRQNTKLDVFNGEIGKVLPHAFDCKKNKQGNPLWRWQKWSLRAARRFQVEFARKRGVRVEFTGEGSVENNLELAYAISIHKAQGSEFERVYLVLPRSKQTLLSAELVYTGVTRATRHLTVLVEGDFTTLASLRRPEKSHLAFINSSVFGFDPLDDRLLTIRQWYEEGRVHSTLAEYMVRSKSEVIIANMLSERGVDFLYEEPLFAPDGTFRLPDFTLAVAGETYFWEHVGMLDHPEYRQEWEVKKAWYERHFPGRLLVTAESPELSREAASLIDGVKGAAL